ncbi:MAG: hypothetical protein SVX43_23715, partial [Cyanobacteriota bacterium]|nr:hypothetical protein [Cyanobacteriota bacterium]
GLIAVAGLLEGLASTVLRIALLPFGTLFPLGLLIFILLALGRGDYFERTRLCFNEKTFEIRRKSSQRKKREGGEIDQIEEIYVSKWRDRAGKVHCGLAIATQSQHKILFFSSTRAREYLFGHQLSELELHGLARDIQEWLNSMRRGG